MRKGKGHLASMNVLKVNVADVVKTNASFKKYDVVSIASMMPTLKYKMSKEEINSIYGKVRKLVVAP